METAGDFKSELLNWKLGNRRCETGGSTDRGMEYWSAAVPGSGNVSCERSEKQSRATTLESGDHRHA